ncbi:MAG: hypothetical protein ABJL99_14285 [Aliishimia sp.]
MKLNLYERSFNHASIVPQHGATSASGNLHRSDDKIGQSPQWAGPVDQIKLGWPDRGDAENGRNEPKLTDAAT